MSALLAGRASRRAYLHLLHNLLPIYAALEPLLDSHRQHAWLRGVWSPGQARLPALQRDMAAFECDVTLPAPVLPASLAYAERLQGLFAQNAVDSAADGCDPHDTSAARLLAHAYVRCLGDLSGGQVLRRVVAQRMGLSAAAGTDFYDFGAPDQVAALLQRWHRGLASLPAEGALADAAVAEACWSFEQHIRLFDQLAAFSLPN